MRYWWAGRRVEVEIVDRAELERRDADDRVDHVRRLGVEVAELRARVRELEEEVAEARADAGRHAARADVAEEAVEHERAERARDREAALACPVGGWN